MNIGEKADEQILSLFLETKDSHFFEVLYTRYTDIVYRKCLSYLHHEQDAQDAAQEIWVKVYFALPSFRQDSSFSTWLYRITVNHCISFLKKRKDCFSIDSTEAQELQSSETLAKSTHEKVDVTNMLACVSKEMKALLLLKYVDGYSYEDIADLAGIGVSAVKMRISRAKKELLAQHTH